MTNDFIDNGGIKMIYGIMLLLIAGVCQGSFGLGYKKYSPFSWAAFWGIYNLICIFTVVCFIWATAPSFLGIIISKGFTYWCIPLLCGALWGLSAIAFSKGIDKIGMSMVYGISMGISTIVGSVMPMIINNSFPAGRSAVMFCVSLALTVIGIIIVTIAGIRRDGGTKGSLSGIILAAISGLGSGAMNVGFSYSESIGGQLMSLGFSQAAISSVKWFPVLAGGCIAGAIWCVGELCVKHEWKTIAGKGNISRILKLFGVSIVWYAALLLYGLSVDMIGDMGNTAGWILFNALALVVSVAWGMKTGEWKNCEKRVIFTGCAVLIAAWVFTAMA